MADGLAVAALVRKRAEMAGRIEHARAELDGTLAGLAARGATLRPFDPGTRVESIRPKPHRPPGERPGIATCNVPGAPREAAGPLAPRRVADAAASAMREQAERCHGTPLSRPFEPDTAYLALPER